MSNNVQHTFHIASQTTLISPTINRVLAPLRELRTFSPQQEIHLCLALEEALQNAIVHGNLEVDSRLRETSTDGYRNEILRRAKISPYSNRKVYIEALLSKNHIVISIEDEGPGFDHRRIPDPTAPENLERPSGRGLLLMRSFMDVVQHNSRGNRVTLVKYASETSTRCSPLPVSSRQHLTMHSTHSQ